MSDKQCGQTQKNHVRRLDLGRNLTDSLTARRKYETSEIRLSFFNWLTILLQKEERDEGMFNDCAVRDDLSI